jgi:hypothetical protein
VDEKLKSHCEQLTGHNEVFGWVKIRIEYIKVGVGLRKKRGAEAGQWSTAAEFAGCGLCI